MKELLERLKAAEERANNADQAWEQEPESVEKENEFNEAYKEEYKAWSITTEYNLHVEKKAA